MFKNLQQEKYILPIGAIALFIGSIFSEGYHHFDEHFQILEFAGVKLGLTEASNLPWEYHYRMRPTLQPTMVVLFYRFFEMFGADNPFFISFFLRFLSGSMAFLSLYMLYNVFKDHFIQKELSRWFLVLSFTLWFVVYVGVRFSSENWSGLLFVIGFSHFFLRPKKSQLTFLAIGALFGLSFLFRFQAAFLTFGFTLWLLIIKKERFTNVLVLVLGFGVAVIAGVLIDSWFYGEFTLSAYNYFDQNLMQNKVSGFGEEPFWWYFSQNIVRGVPPISFLYLTGFAAVLVFRPKSPVIWSLIPFLLVHCLIGHKEMRFLFPMCFFLPLLMVQGIEVLQERFQKALSQTTAMRVFMKVVLTVNSLVLLVVVFKPADSQISLYRALYSNYKEPTTLYCIDKNPYERVLDIYFYKRNDLTVTHVNSIDDIPERENALVVSGKGELATHHRVGKLVYQTYPDWSKNFNINNWQERSLSWYVFEVD